MPTSRRSALQAIAATLGIAGAAPEIAAPSTSAPETTAIPSAVIPRPFYTAKSFPMLPCRIQDVTPAELESYEYAYYWLLEEHTYEACTGLEAARYWYRNYPELVTAEHFPEELLWAYSVRGIELGVWSPERGPVAPGLLENCRTFAEKHVEIRRKAGSNPSAGTHDMERSSVLGPSPG